MRSAPPTHRRHARAEHRPALRAGALATLIGDAETHPAGAGDVSVMDVVEAELVEDRQPIVPADVVDAVLDAYLDNGRLVPAKVGELAGLDPADTRRAERARMLDRMRSNAFADSTLHNYGYGVQAWRAWCRAEGIPALPFDPLQVANHLVDYAFSWDAEADVVRRDLEGEPLAAVVVGSVDLRLAALNKAAEFIGLPKPGDNAGVRELMRGLRRTLLTAKQHQKKALTHALLQRCLEAATGRNFVSARLRAAVLLRARTGATAGQLERLVWADVTLSGEDTATIVLPPAHRHGTPAPIRLAAHPTNPDLCLIRALRDLRAISPQLTHVFGHFDGSKLSRQALHLAVSKAAAGSGGWVAVAGLPDRDLAALLRDDGRVSPLQTSRDRALLLTGFWGALRRSNLSMLRWRDLVDHTDDGIEIILRRSKTDQEGHGASVWAPPADPASGVPCPATALRAWRRQVTAALGRPPLPDEHVFARLTGGGTLMLDSHGRLRRLSGESINEVVQRLTVAAGVAQEPKNGERHGFGAHSLRAGWVTEAAMAGMSLTDIMGVTKHKSPQIVMEYVRRVDAARNNGARQLLGQLGTPTATSVTARR